MDEGAYWCFRGKLYAEEVFPRRKIYTDILFHGAILSRMGFSVGKFYAGGGGGFMQQHRQFKLVCGTLKQSHMQTFSSICQSM